MESTAYLGQSGQDQERDGACRKEELGHRGLSMLDMSGIREYRSTL